MPFDRAELRRALEDSEPPPPEEVIQAKGDDRRARLRRALEEPGKTEQVEQVGPPIPEEIEAIPTPPFQSLAEKFGVTPQPVPQIPQPAFEPFDMPAPIREMQGAMRDMAAAVRAEEGLNVAGNLPAKVEALRRDSERDRKSITEQNFAELAVRTAKGAIRELREIPTAFGMLPAWLRQKGMDVTRGIQRMGASGVGIETSVARLRNPETGEEEKLLLYQSVPDMDPRMREGLLAMGARFGPEPFQESTLDIILESEAKRAGLVNPDEIPEGATSFGVPLTDRRFVPREFAEQTVDRPISRLLDATLLAGVPSALAGGGARATAAGSRAAAKVGAESAERGLVRSSLLLSETSEKLANPIGRGLGLVTRKGVALTPPGREFLARMDAKFAARRLIRESSDNSFAARRSAEIELSRAFRGLSDDELKLLPAVMEGRASVLPGKVTPQFDHALNVAKKQIRDVQAELMESGFLKSETIANRSLAPMVVTRTSKRIPPKNWDDARIVKENQLIRKQNADLSPGSERFPEFLTQARLQRELSAVRSDLDFAAAEMAGRPDLAVEAPIYFPRFPDPPTLREIAKEFFPTKGKRPGKLPIQKQFSGWSILRNADVRDVHQQLVRHNAQSRRILDSEKLIRQLEGQPFTKPLKIGKNGQPVDLLPGHVPYAPDGFLAFYRRQVDLGEETARALEAMGDFESALAQGVKNALGNDLRLSFPAVSRRTNILQVPREVAAEINKTFAPTHPFVRLFFDRPTEAWKAGVLAFSPRWHINNMVGGMIMGSNAGVPARKLLSRMTKAEKDALPQQLAVQSQVFVDSFKPNLGSAAETFSGRVSQAIFNSKPIQFVARPVADFRDLSFAFNAAVDAHFRGRAYLEIAGRAARTQTMKETGKAVLEGRELLKQTAKLSADPKMQRQLIGKLDKVFVNFGRMNDFERRYMRRMVPFWSWYREIHRVTLSMPFTMPARAQGLRLLGELGTQADDLEVRRHLGIPKEFLPQYLEDRVFVGMGTEGEVQFMSPRGMNVYYGVGRWPIDPSALHPAIKLVIEEMTGGKTFGRWGSYAPFKFKEAGVRSELEEGTGRLVEKRPGRALGKRVARTIPLTNLVEDLVQYGTEGIVSTRFEDTSPIGNIIPSLTGGRVTPTVVPDAERRPRRERQLGEVTRSFFGVTTSRYRLLEILEQEAKSSKRDINTIINNKLTTDPEFRKLFTETLGEMAGEPERPLERLRGEQQ